MKYLSFLDLQVLFNYKVNNIILYKVNYVILSGYVCMHTWPICVYILLFFSHICQCYICQF